jgi:hypothetical protein
LSGFLWSVWVNQLLTRKVILFVYLLLLLFAVLEIEFRDASSPKIYLFISFINK